ncbi:tetratricopeptide repeat protein, partial [Streptomyces fuscigenes]|uniref:tetratricopeptide repeat protein n=1 Tax=Streptomyces fuscigenes TaxID=1528880 RepID=UPI001F1D359F
EGPRTAAPGPAEAARALPVPLPDPADPATVVLTQQTTQSPDRIAAESSGNASLRTPEAAFWLCRAYLEAGDTGQAEAWLDRARERLRTASDGSGGSAENDWRLPWHTGVLYLTRGEVARAADEFAVTYTLIPGEWAPKLALGYCSEAGGAAGSLTKGYYEAVWRRNKSQGSAALGLARVHLRDGEREEAVKVLDAVPATSRHHDVARIAAVRVLAGCLDGHPPTAGQLVRAHERLERLDLEGEAAARLAAEVLGTAWACVPAEGWQAPLHEREFFGADAADLDRRYFEALRALAGQAADARELGALLDRAHDVRPESRF